MKNSDQRLVWINNYSDLKNSAITSVLIYIEALKIMPFGAVWDFYCEFTGVPNDIEWIGEVLRYEEEADNKDYGNHECLIDW